MLCCISRGNIFRGVRGLLSSHFLECEVNQYCSFDPHTHIFVGSTKIDGSFTFIEALSQDAKFPVLCRSCISRRLRKMFHVRYGPRLLKNNLESRHSLTHQMTYCIPCNKQAVEANFTAGLHCPVSVVWLLGNITLLHYTVFITQHVSMLRAIDTRALSLHRATLLDDDRSLASPLRDRWMVARTSDRLTAQRDER